MTNELTVTSPRTRYWEEGVEDDEKQTDCASEQTTVELVATELGADVVLGQHREGHG